jgi:hypothetical protein
MWLIIIIYDDYLKCSLIFVEWKLITEQIRKLTPVLVFAILFEILVVIFPVNLAIQII